METLVYRGNARIYLQGKGALQPVDISDINCYTYFVGSVESSIKLLDFRYDPNKAAEARLNNRLDREFADIFNQPAEVDISEKNGNVEIELKLGRQDNESPILWIGVIDDGKMPVHKIAWETLKPIQGGAIAFAALVSG
ncbi:hypothetical protein FBQ81_13775 [Chloroflexi bacterium CFX6]|nr:hypothetical protein [Chloroflexi bacterium CFX6]